MYCPSSIVYCFVFTGKKTSTKPDMKAKRKGTQGNNIQVSIKNLHEKKTWSQQGPRLYNFFIFNSNEHETILLINAKMPTTVDILTFMSRINTSYESLKARNTYLFSILVFMSS